MSPVVRFQWLYGLLEHNRTREFQLLWMANMAHGQGRGTFASYEQFCVQGDPLSDYQVTALLVLKNNSNNNNNNNKIRQPM